MGLLSGIFSGNPISGVIDSVTGILDKFIPDQSAKNEFKLELETILQKRDSEIEQTARIKLEAKERVIVAELQQGDKYTKRARPTVVYFGLFFFFFNYSVVRLLGYPSMDIPPEFMIGWAGIVGTWSLGRDAVRRGVKNKLTNIATGDNGGVLGL